METLTQRFHISTSPTTTLLYFEFTENILHSPKISTSAFSNRLDA